MHVSKFPLAPSGPRRALLGIALIGWLAAVGRASAPPAQSEDPQPVFIEVELPLERLYVQQPLILTLRFGFERSFLAERAVQPFRRPLDLPAQVEAEWLDGLPGAPLSPPVPGAGSVGDGDPIAGPSFALNGEVARARALPDRLVGERRFVVLELERTLLPERAGPLTLTAPTLGYAHATRFREDLLAGRVPLDRVDAVLRGPERTVEVLPLPERGRPLDFTGAVGRFSIEAQARPRNLTVDEGFELMLRIEGAGNLDHLEPPRLDRLDGFHLLGRSIERDPTGLTATYHLAARRADLRELPEIPFAYFDPTPPGEYLTVRTRPIPLTVRAGPGGGDPGAQGEPAAAPGGRSWIPWLGASLLIAAAAFLFLRRRVPGEPGSRAHARVSAVSAAAESFARDAAGGEPNLPDALGRFLAAVLEAPESSLRSRGLAARLQASGVSAELAERAASLFDELGAERYGRSGSALEPARVTALVSAMSAELGVPPADRR